MFLIFVFLLRSTLIFTLLFPTRVLLPTLLLPALLVVLFRTVDVFLFLTLAVAGRVVAVLFRETFGFVAALFVLVLGRVVALFVVALGLEVFLLVVALWPPFIDLLGVALEVLGLDIERPPPLEAPWLMRCARISVGQAKAKKTKRMPSLCLM